MNDLRNENDKTKLALSVMGNGYVIIPRNVFMDLYGDSEAECQTAWLYLALWICCNYEDRYVIINNMTFMCKRGEYIGTYQYLSRITKFTYNTVRRLIKLLAKRGLIKTKRLPVGISIYIYGYHELTCPGNTKKAEKMVLTPFQQMKAYEEKVKKGIRN